MGYVQCLLKEIEVLAMVAKDEQQCEMKSQQYYELHMLLVHKSCM